MRHIIRSLFIILLLAMAVAFCFAQEATTGSTDQNFLVQFFGANTAAILMAVFGVLWAISELLAQIPGIAANGVFQAISNGLKRLLGK